MTAADAIALVVAAGGLAACWWATGVLLRALLGWANEEPEPGDTGRAGSEKP